MEGYSQWIKHGEDEDTEVSANVVDEDDI